MKNNDKQEIQIISRNDSESCLDWVWSLQLNIVCKVTYDKIRNIAWSGALHFNAWNALSKEKLIIRNLRLGILDIFPTSVYILEFW